MGQQVTPFFGMLSTEFQTLLTFSYLTFDLLMFCLFVCVFVSLFVFFYQGSEWLIKSDFSSWTNRNNLEWLGRATNWAKFTATASLGVIHRVGKSVCMCLLYLFTLSVLLQTVTNYMYVHVRLKLSQAS